MCTCSGVPRPHLEVGVVGEGLDALQLGRGGNAVNGRLAAATGGRCKREDLVLNAVESRLGDLVALVIDDAKDVEHLPVVGGFDGGSQDVQLQGRKRAGELHEQVALVLPADVEDGGLLIDVVVKGDGQVERILLVGRGDRGSHAIGCTVVVCKW